MKKEESKNLRIELMKIMNLLQDTESHIPVYLLVLSQIQKMIKDRGRGGLIHILINRGEELEEVYGWEYFDDLIKVVSNYLNEHRERLFGCNSFLTKKIVRGSSFLVFLDDHSPETMRKKSINVRNELQEVVNEKFKSVNLRGLKILTGYSEIVYDPLVRFERSVERAIERSIYRLIQEGNEFEEYSRLNRIIQEERINIHYQPILHIRKPAIVGYEALLRVKNGVFYDSPGVVIEIARKSGLLLELERLIYNKAISRFKTFWEDHLLFINTTVYFVNYFERFEDEFTFLLKENGLDKSQLVIEITEKFSIDSIEDFKKSIKRIKDKGYKISIDDVGTGYSTLEVLAELEPEYLKYDRSLIKNIHLSNIKQELFKSIKKFADSIGAHLVAEGVETEEELKFLLGQGVEMVQGFYFAEPSEELVREIRRTGWN